MLLNAGGVPWWVFLMMPLMMLGMCLMMWLMMRMMMGMDHGSGHASPPAVPPRDDESSDSEAASLRRQIAELHERLAAMEVKRSGTDDDTDEGATPAPGKGESP
ncbi:MAG: hypothetical protein AAB092_00930 [Chloroflexota bacterium]